MSWSNLTSSFEKGIRATVKKIDKLLDIDEDSTEDPISDLKIDSDSTFTESPSVSETPKNQPPKLVEKGQAPAKKVEKLLDAEDGTDDSISDLKVDSDYSFTETPQLGEMAKKVPLLDADDGTDDISDLRIDSDSTFTETPRLGGTGKEKEMLEGSTAKMAVVQPRSLDFEGDSWLAHGTEGTAVVDHEPNPIRDSAAYEFETQFHRSTPSPGHQEHTSDDLSNGSQEGQQQPVDTKSFSTNDSGDSDHEEGFEGVKLDDGPVSEHGGETSPTVHFEQIGRRNSDLTVASSDIEIIHHIDAWSTNSQPPYNPPLLARADPGTSALVQEHRLDSLKKKNETLKQTINQMNRRLDASNEERVTLAKNLSQAEMEKATLQDEKKKAQDELFKLHGEIRKLKAKFESSESLRTSVATSNRKLREELDKVIEQAESADTHESAMQKKIDELEARLKETTTAQLKASEISECAEAQIQGLSFELERQKQALVAVMMEKEEITKKHNLLLSDLKMKETAKTTERLGFDHNLMTKLAQDEVAELKEELAMTQRKLNTKTEEYEAAMRHLKDQLKGDHEKLQNALALKTLEMMNLEARLTQGRDAYDKLHRSTQEQYQQLSQQLNTSINALNQQLHQERLEKDACAEELSTLRAEFAALQQRPGVDPNVLTQLRQLVAEKTEECNRLETEYNRVLVECGGLIERQKELELDVLDLKDQLRNLSEEQAEAAIRGRARD
ncbi:unnamed protein product, partial [Mesorhabditis spiculigera]